MKEFLKAASSHMNRFLKAAVVDSFKCGFFNTVCRCFQKPVDVAISGFKNPLMPALAAFETFFNQKHLSELYTVNLVKRICV